MQFHSWMYFSSTYKLAQEGLIALVTGGVFPGHKLTQEGLISSFSSWLEFGVLFSWVDECQDTLYTFSQCTW